jgi:hypothetical protein
MAVRDYEVCRISDIASVWPSGCWAHACTIFVAALSSAARDPATAVHVLFEPALSNVPTLDSWTNTLS